MAAVEMAVRGRVQGVGFRAFVYRTAVTFGVGGEVWNTGDGSVRIFAEHEDPEHLGAFVKLMHDGPGRVDSVDVLPAPPRSVTRFEVGRTR